MGSDSPSLGITRVRGGSTPGRPLFAEPRRFGRASGGWCAVGGRQTCSSRPSRNANAALPPARVRAPPVRDPPTRAVTGRRRARGDRRGCRRGLEYVPQRFRVVRRVRPEYRCGGGCRRIVNSRHRHAQSSIASRPAATSAGTAPCRRLRSPPCTGSPRRPRASSTARGSIMSSFTARGPVDGLRTERSAHSLEAAPGGAATDSSRHRLCKGFRRESLRSQRPPTA